MRLCLYPGTFDPLTHGHLDVVARAARIFDRVVIAVAASQDKGPFFSVEERLELIRANLAPFGNVSADSFSGLLVEYARARQAAALIRGLRAISDFEFEFQMALMNRHLDPHLETVFLMPREEYSYISSRIVKAVAKHGGDISRYVPANVHQALRARFRHPLKSAGHGLLEMPD